MNIEKGLSVIQIESISLWNPETFGVSLEAFQAFIPTMKRLEAEGMINIEGDPHWETYTGNSYVDIITFRRLK